MSEKTHIRSVGSGVNQRGIRAHNERLILSVLQRHGAMSGQEIARKTALSAQTISVILRKLESDNFLLRGHTTKGKVGKPSVPMRLNPDAVFSAGFKVGRRSAELVLMDFCGGIRAQIRAEYDYPLPDMIFEFLKNGLETVKAHIPLELRDRLCGLGIAAPFEIWKWSAVTGAEAESFLSWKDVRFDVEVAKFSPLPVFVVNDATGACWAEHVYGRGKEFRDYAYFFISAFIGGGVVLNHSVFEGYRGNAGALGSLRARNQQGESCQLVDVASIHVLAATLTQNGLDSRKLWHLPRDWSTFTAYVDPWIVQTASEVAKASLSACAVIDFEAVVIDGSFPEDVKAALVAQVRTVLATQDARGLIIPQIVQGTIGDNARAIGAASGPIFAQFLLNTNSDEVFGAPAVPD